jgi:hypothetical protein
VSHPPEEGTLAYISAHLPGHRYSEPLLHAAAYLNREVGPLRRAYVIGTKPLVVAFLEENPNLKAYRDAATSQPTTGPGLEIMRTRRGTLIPIDNRRRDVRLVLRENLDAPVNIVLSFPSALTIGPGYAVGGPVGGPETERLTATVRVLRTPISVSQLLDELASGADWTAATEELITLPVRKP